MKIKDKVLIVEDEQSISNFISMVLNANGYDTIIVGSGEEALTMIASHCPDLIVLDLGLPDMDGMEVLKSVRKWSNLPVVVVSARNHEHDKVDALDYGADDYLVKPFGVMEMVSRVKAVLRRCHPADTGHVLSAEGLSMDLDCRTVTADGQRLQLTYKEFELLRLFLSHPGMAFTREQLFTQVWNMEYMDDSRTLDMHIRTLRQKLGAYGKLIETVRNVGYRMEIGL